MVSSWQGKAKISQPLRGFEMTTGRAIPNVHCHTVVWRTSKIARACYQADSAIVCGTKIYIEKMSDQLDSVTINANRSFVMSSARFTICTHAGLMLSVSDLNVAFM